VIPAPAWKLTLIFEARVVTIVKKTFQPPQASFARPNTIGDTNYQVTIPPQTGSGFFRLAIP
jgi:hypothetical protein